MKKTTKPNIYKEWMEKAIFPNQFVWWFYKLQFWRYKEVIKGVLFDKTK